MSQHRPLTSHRIGPNNTAMLTFKMGHLIGLTRKATKLSKQPTGMNRDEGYQPQQS